MAQLISYLEDKSAEAMQTRARTKEFLSTIVAKAQGKPLESRGPEVTSWTRI